MVRQKNKKKKRKSRITEERKSFHHWLDMIQGQFLSRIKLVLFFPSPRPVFLTKASEHNLPKYLLNAEVRIDEFMFFQKALPRSETQTRPRFELESPITIPSTITVRLCLPPKKKKKKKKK